MDETRRNLLFWMLTLPFAPLWLERGGRGIAAALPTRYALNEFFVAGFQFYPGPDRIAGFLSAERFALIPEPENQFDRFAVRVEREGEKIGYIPRTQNQTIHHLLQQGATLYASATEINPNGPTWSMLKVQVWLEP